MAGEAIASAGGVEGLIACRVHLVVTVGIEVYAVGAMITKARQRTTKEGVVVIIARQTATEERVVVEALAEEAATTKTSHDVDVFSVCEVFGFEHRKLRKIGDDVSGLRAGI